MIIRAVSTIRTFIIVQNITTRILDSREQRTIMIVKSTWIRTITILALFSTRRLNTLGEITSTESSAEYLRKVMLELRGINLPPPLPATERSTGSLYFDVDDKRYLAGKRHSSGKRVALQSSNGQNNLLAQALILQSVAKKIRPGTLDHVMAETATNNDVYYQIPAAVLSPSQNAAETSSIAKPELNAVYNRAIEKGLANVLLQKQLAKATTGQLEIGESQPMYSYYFYPFESFTNNVHQDSHYLPGVSFRPDNAGLTEDSQKNISNPLFMAVSGFIGMAVLFMIGVLLFPRFGDFRSRIADDEKYQHLTKTISEAIDRLNCTDTGEPQTRLDERLRLFCESAKTPKPSSVVLLTRKSALRKEAKRRRQIPKKCKTASCKRNVERNGTT